MSGPTAEVLAGAGTACRYGAVAVWLGPDVPGELAADVIAAVADGATLPGPDVLARIRVIVGARDAGSFAAAALPSPGAPAVSGLVHGAAVVQNGRGDARSGALTDELLDVALPADGVIGLWGTAPLPAGGTGPVAHDLAAGTVRGGGLVIRSSPRDAATRTGAPPAAAPPPPPAADPAPPASLDPTTNGPPPGVGGPDPAPVDEPRPAREVVQGIRCANGHLNHQGMRHCRACGIEVVDQGAMVEGERPPLGVIVLADGSTFTLDDGYLLGREPSGDPRVRSIVIDDRRVSRRHAQISLTGWDVTVTDLGSSNGTYLRNPGWSRWTRSTPQEPRVVEPGGHIGVGGQVLVYESTARPA